MIFQTQLKHCFTKYECQLQGWVAWIQISTWLALHWTDFGACPAVSSAEKGCTEIFHENRDRHWKPKGTPPAPDLPSRAESKATSSVLQFVKVEQDTLLPCGRGEWKRQTSNSSSLLFWAESMEQKSWYVGSATRAGTVPHAPATSLRQRSIQTSKYTKPDQKRYFEGRST